MSSRIRREETWPRRWTNRRVGSSIERQENQGHGQSAGSYPATIPIVLTTRSPWDVSPKAFLPAGWRLDPVDISLIAVS